MGLRDQEADVIGRELRLAQFPVDEPSVRITNEQKARQSAGLPFLLEEEENDEQSKTACAQFISLRTRAEGTINAMVEMELVRMDEQTRTMTLKFPLRGWEMNPVGRTHGGILCTLLDMAMGGCCLHIQRGGVHADDPDVGELRQRKRNRG